MKFDLVDAEKAHFPVAMMCRLLDVSRSGFYAAQKRPVSAHEVDDQRLAVEVAAVHEESRKTYGSPRVYAQLKYRGISVGRHRVARLMREQGLRSRRARRFVHTTDSSHELPIAPNLLAREFWPTSPDSAWSTDITYVPTGQGWLYLAVVLDLFSRRVVGWVMSDKIDRELTLSALRMALSARAPKDGLLHHSDQGVQYVADDYQLALDAAGIWCSMSRRGNCWDNAPTESFFGTLKSEFIHHERFATREDASARIFEFIEVFYNRERLHSSLGNKSPAQFENEAAGQKRAA